MLRLYRTCDALTEGLIYFAILFGPWAFGTTQGWSIHVMNGVGMTLGLLWLVKLGLRSTKRQRPGSVRRAPGALPERHFTWLLATGTIFILLYCLVSAWNARAIYQPELWNFEYLPAIPWLPHSYDRECSCAAFWMYLGLAGLFWALRDWLLSPAVLNDGRRTTDDQERLEGSGQWSVVSASSPRLPARLRRLFWVLTINGTALAMQGLMQRAEGGNQLLWLVEPHINKTADAQFGPYAYRANAAQYFNLLWPAALGFWWAGVSSLRRHRSGGNAGRLKRLAVLLPCVLIMAVCPLVSASRGGAMVLVGSLILAGGILTVAQWRKSWVAKATMLLGLAAVVVTGALLGWQTLAPRMQQLPQGYALREGLYQAGRYMAADNAWFGTGPGTFSTLYQLYRRDEIGNLEDSVAQMHNDWLETRITFGWLGTIPILLTLLLVLTHWFRGGGIHGNKYFVMLLWVALGGCLLHAVFDFPLQVHSVLTLFLILCAVLSCLARGEMQNT
jgi:O-antigen ligase